MEKEQEFKQEHPKVFKQEEQLIELIQLKEELSIEEIESLVFTYDENQDGEISLIETQENDNHESLYQALIKLGVSPDALKSVLGIESKEVRKERQDIERLKRKEKSNNRRTTREQPNDKRPTNFRNKPDGDKLNNDKKDNDIIS